MSPAPGARVIRVHLTSIEMAIANTAAGARHISALKEQREAFGSRPEERARYNFEGACAELAVAKHYRRYWNSAYGHLKADDVGPYQVRETPRADAPLVIRPRDREHRPYILVTGVAPDFVLVGWIWGRDAKRPEWWGTNGRPGPPAWWVPQSALAPMAELPDEDDVLTQWEIHRLTSP